MIKRIEQKASNKSIRDSKVNKALLEEALKKMNNEVAATVQKEIKETKTENPIKIQRVFTLVGDTRKDSNRYIIIRVSYMETDKQAESLVNTICKKMTELDDQYKLVYKPVKKPEIDKEEKSYTDLISYEKVSGQIALQRQYVGKLMTKALAALK